MWAGKDLKDTIFPLLGVFGGGFIDTYIATGIV